MQTEKKLPKLLNREDLYHGKKFDLSIDTVCEDERVYRREVVHHPGSAVILPLFADGSIALVRQYRHPVVRYLLEAPAGTLDKDERPEEAAARELAEEVGLIAGQLEQLSEFFVSPGFCAEKMWLYLATDLTETTQHLDEDEIVEVVRLPFSTALQMISEGGIEDAKTIIGLMLAAPHVGPAMLEAAYPAV